MPRKPVLVLKTIYTYKKYSLNFKCLDGTLLRIYLHMYKVSLFIVSLCHSLSLHTYVYVLNIVQQYSKVRSFLQPNKFSHVINDVRFLHRKRGNIE